MQGRRHGFLSRGSNRRQGGQPTPKYPKNRKKHRILAASFSNLGGRNPRFSKVRGSGPPDPPSATPLYEWHGWVYHRRYPTRDSHQETRWATLHPKNSPIQPVTARLSPVIAPLQPMQ